MQEPASRKGGGAWILSCAATFSLALSGCSTSPDESATQSLSTVVVGDVERRTIINAPADQSQIKSLVLILGGQHNQEFLQESIETLNHGQYATLIIDDAEKMQADELAVAFDDVAENSGHRLPQTVLAFGSAGPKAWEFIAVDSARIESAFLISSPLPNGDFDFARLKETGIKAVFAEDGPVYSSSYERAHHPMSEIPTPHDFIIYGGGITDTYYDQADPDFDQATWRATLDSIPEWFDIWAAGDASETPEHEHEG